MLEHFAHDDDVEGLIVEGHHEILEPHALCGNAVVGVALDLLGIFDEFGHIGRRDVVSQAAQRHAVDTEERTQFKDADGTSAGRAELENVADGPDVFMAVPGDVTRRPGAPVDARHALRRAGDFQVEVGDFGDRAVHGRDGILGWHSSAPDRT